MRGSSPHTSTAAAIAIAALLGTPACGPSESPALEVFAASSLAEAFRAMAQEFESAHPEVAVALTLAGSQVLRLQIEQGAPADVFAAADEVHLEALAGAGRVLDDTVFATNELVIIVPQDNPAGLESFADLPRAQRLVIGVAAVPVGRYTRLMLERSREVFGEEFVAAVESAVVSAESNVRLVRAKVELGEADAAIVYRTDAVGVAGLRTVSVPASVNVRGVYRIGIVAGASNAAAPQWVQFVLSERGRAILDRHGFGAPR